VNKWWKYTPKTVEKLSETVKLRVFGVEKAQQTTKSCGPTI
jgi:hypothetical protein